MSLPAIPALLAMGAFAAAGKLNLAIEASDVERDLRPLARRYLGAAGGDAFVNATRDEHRDNVLVRMRPERWFTADYGKAGARSGPFITIQRRSTTRARLRRKGRTSWRTAVAMDLRNATTRRLGVPDLTATVLTVTAAAADSSLAAGDNPRLGRRLAAILTMLAGAATGAWLLRYGLAFPFVVSTLCTLGVTAMYRAVPDEMPAP